MFITYVNGVFVMLCRARRNAGFSLIELMIVVVMIGILASVAYPSYTEHIKKSRIAQATAMLADLQIRMERYFQDNRTYLAGGGACGVDAAASNDEAFNYSCNATAPAFTLTAAGKGSMNGFAFTVDQDNLRKTTAFPGMSGTVDCWMTRRGDTC